MRSPVVRSTFDVVLWLLARGASAGVRLSAQKLQRLLYLAQAHYAAANEDRKLMPATFLANDLGPLEPTVFHVLDGQAPKLKPDPLKTEVVVFLDGLWARYGSQSADDLLALVQRDLAYRECQAEDESNVEIEIAALADAYRLSPPLVEPPADDREFWTPSGKKAEKWLPGGGKQAPKSAPKAATPAPKPAPQTAPKSAPKPAPKPAAEPSATIVPDKLPPQLREVVAETQAAEQVAKEAEAKPASLDELDTDNLPPDVRAMVERVRGPGRKHSAPDPDKSKK